MIVIDELGLELDYYPNGKVHYVRERVGDTVLNGIYKDWYQNGKPWEESYYKNDDLNGPYTYWFDNGNKMEESTYVDGKLHGLSTEWHPNGNIAKQRAYVRHLAHGIYTKWFENGNIESISYYSDDRNVTAEIKSVVKDIANITEYEKTLIQLKFGIDV